MSLARKNIVRSMTLVGRMLRKRRATVRNLDSQDCESWMEFFVDPDGGSRL